MIVAQYIEARVDDVGGRVGHKLYDTLSSSKKLHQHNESIHEK